MYTEIYSDNIPPIIEELILTPQLQRLKDIGMHCGCEYANFPIYSSNVEHYSRFIHSIGVANIIWNFTGDIKQSVAGLLHDISTPVFAHSIDFMNNDHMSQESTESLTRHIIENSTEIMKVLNSYNINIDDVFDYHIYPIADNNTPMLSADRLEYTFGNAYLVHGYKIDEIKEMYHNIKVLINENGISELGFTTKDKAIDFTKISLLNSQWFVSDEDRFSMQYVADLIRFSIENNILSFDDLLTTETKVIEKLKGNSETSKKWTDYQQISSVSSSKEKPKDRYSVNISAKKRYINPLVMIGDSQTRILDIDLSLQKETDELLQRNFDRWIFANEHNR